jgi:hypothetical protein
MDRRWFQKGEVGVCLLHAGVVDRNAVLTGGS